MNKLLKAKHWQIFMFFLTLSFFQGIFRSFNDYLSALFYNMYIFSYIGWLLHLGNHLRSIVLKPIMNYRVFVVAGCTLIVVVFTNSVLVLLKSDFMQIFDNIWAILLMMGYLLVTLIILTSFVGKNLKIIEVGEEIDINDYFGDILGLIFWPIGIWTFQPRINRLVGQ